MSNRFKEKIVVVTGAASGIGRAQVTAFLQEGAIVVGIDIENATVVHDRYTHFVGSVTDQAFIDETIVQLGRIDILLTP